MRTQRLFAAHFVKPGLLDQAHLKTLGRLESDRLRADYQGFHRFGPADVDRSREPVASLVRDVLSHLAQQEPSVLSEQGAAIRAALGALD